MPRFVILRHEPPPGRGRPPHWDLMLESGAVLRTWALAELPASGRTIAAEALADHRSSYLDYQGPVSGDRGTVSRWDAGTFRWVSDTACEIAVLLDGNAVSGRVELTRDAETSSSWQLVFYAAG